MRPRLHQATACFGSRASARRNASSASVGLRCSLSTAPRLMYASEESGLRPMAWRKCASASAARPLSRSTMPRRLCATASLPLLRSVLVNDASASSSRPSENALLALANARDLRSDANIDSPLKCRIFAQAVDKWRRSVAITPTADQSEIASYRNDREFDGLTIFARRILR